jgi:hypothetical protein
VIIRRADVGIPFHPIYNDVNRACTTTAAKLILTQREVPLRTLNYDYDCSGLASYHTVLVSHQRAWLMFSKLEDVGVLMHRLGTK